MGDVDGGGAVSAPFAQRNPVPALIEEWRAVRRELAAIERAEHPDIVDHHGRTWAWKAGDLYTHDSMAWREVMVRNRSHGLPYPLLAGNPNYKLCDICTKEWPR